jgi:hypothetical protein
MNCISLLKFSKVAALALAVVCIGSNSILASGQAAPVAGYDFLQTGDGASVDLTSTGLGVVPLQGVPIEAALGVTDTIMHRPTNTVFTQSQSLLVTALFMKSVNSVEFQGQAADLYITLNNSAGAIPTTTLPQPDTLNTSGGNITVTGSQSNGGTFNATFVMNADAIFVPAGASVTNPANYIAHQAAPQVSFSPATSTWNTTPPAGYPSSTTFPSGGFYPIMVAHTNGPHPVTPSKCGSAVTTSTNERGEAVTRPVCISVAQPQ